jgi:prolyl oligopeptidase
MEEPVQAPIKEITDTLFGEKIKDPYRYMENLNDTTVIKWFKIQEDYSNKVIENITGYKKLEKIINNLEKGSPYTISKYKVTKNDFYFYLKKTNDKNFSNLYYRECLLGKEKIIFNPKTYNPNENYLINYIQPSWDGSKIAISLTKKDKEFSKIIVFDISLNRVLKGFTNNSFPNGLSGVDWLSDNSGFLYTYIPIVDSKAKGYLYNSKAVLYKIGKTPGDLIDVFSKENNPRINFNEEDFPLVYFTSQENNFILGEVAGVSKYRDTYYMKSEELTKNKINWILLFSKQEQIKQFIVNGNELIYRTSKNATNYKICKTSLLNPNFKNPSVLIDEDPISVITDFELTKQGLFYVKTKNGVDAKLYHLKNSKIKHIPIPKASGRINISSKGSEFDNPWIEIEGWISKKERYLYDVENNLFKKENLNSVTEVSKLDNVVVKEVEVISHDGTKVPLSIIHKKNIKLNGNNRLFITGYGAYGYSEKPSLNDYLLNWINVGGIYAVAHVRGGGEKGNAWHKGGFKTTKPNTWKDFISCTEYLIENKYSSPKRIAVWSASAGGILIGRSITERPDLFAAGIIRVGKINTLRSEFGPNGKNNIKEYGTVKDSVEFKALLEMDAYHHVKKGENYPAIYLTAGINDARVPAWQPAKFAARLQSVNVSNNPILLSVDFEGGHGHDSSSEKNNKELSKILSFALWQTGHPDYQPKK